MELGVARKYLTQDIFSLKKEKITPKMIRTLENHVRFLTKYGELKEQASYSDLPLLWKAQIFINKFSEQLAREANIYLKQYSRADNLKQRREIFEKHEYFRKCSQLIDKVLKRLSDVLN